MPHHHSPPAHQLQGDEGQLFEAFDSDLRRITRSRLPWVPQTIIDDACNEAWARLLRRQPDRETVRPWLKTVAVHEALRLLRRETRENPINWDEAPQPASPDDVQTAADARQALGALAALPDKQRHYLTLHIAGHTYDEIQTLTGSTRTNVNKHLVKARAALVANI